MSNHYKEFWNFGSHLSSYTLEKVKYNEMQGRVMKSHGRYYEILQQFHFKLLALAK